MSDPHGFGASSRSRRLIEEEEAFADDDRWFIEEEAFLTPDPEDGPSPEDLEVQ